MARRTGKLSEEQKAFVVQRLACFDAPKEVAAAVKSEFGVEITPQGCEAYNPKRRAGAKLAKRWIELFWATREAFLKDINEIPLANKAVRLRHLDRMAQAAEARNNYVLASNLLEQIAKEVGNSFTNRRELTGKDGKDLPAATGAVVILPAKDPIEDKEKS